MDSKEAFGVALREARQKFGISQEKLADAIEMDRTTIYLLERGSHSPTLETIWKICDKLDVAPNRLVARVEQILDDAAG